MTLRTLYGYVSSLTRPVTILLRNRYCVMGAWSVLEPAR